MSTALLPWFAGRFWRQYQELVRAGWERAERLEHEQRLLVEQARSRERARIAQDMHDVLGHDLSLIALSAGALKLAPGLEEAQRVVAGEIRARAAASVERLGEVIGILREEVDDEPSRASDTGIPRLVADASAAGLVVDLRIDHDDAPRTEGITGVRTDASTPPATGNAISTCATPATGAAAGSTRTGTTPSHNAPPAAARAAHRVVQEALTNAAAGFALAEWLRAWLRIAVACPTARLAPGRVPARRRHGGRGRRSHRRCCRSGGVVGPGGRCRGAAVGRLSVRRRREPGRSSGVAGLFARAHRWP
ncbi:sensor histidine kinase [Streptomyces yunnanensis]|uniref:sensor histidine kinase n=1 Tax=Streptomyces yunnanensis TaxID=156453 RepID=UPI003B834788